MSEVGLVHALFHAVLHEPQIPNNTGNIGRTCVAVGTALHLIHPLGFDLSEKACRRAGLDYWPRLDLHEHENWKAYQTASPDSRQWILTTRASRSLYNAEIRRGDHFIFGKEDAGLPESVLRTAPEQQMVSLPMMSGERSLNLATVVCTVLYEGVRQLLARGEIGLDQQGRLLMQS